MRRLSPPVTPDEAATSHTTCFFVTRTFDVKESVREYREGVSRSLLGAILDHFWGSLRAAQRRTRRDPEVGASSESVHSARAHSVQQNHVGWSRHRLQDSGRGRHAHG